MVFEMVEGFFDLFLCRVMGGATDNEKNEENAGENGKPDSKAVPKKRLKIKRVEKNDS